MISMQCHEWIVNIECPTAMILTMISTTRSSRLFCPPWEDPSFDDLKYMPPLFQKPDDFVSTTPDSLVVAFLRRPRRKADISIVCWRDDFGCFFYSSRWCRKGPTKKRKDLKRLIFSTQKNKNKKKRI